MAALSGTDSQSGHGGAIRGPGHFDWFIGSDEASELQAGHLKQAAEVWFLAPVDVK